MGQLGARLVVDEEETQAQNKVLFGMFLLMLIYPTAFVVMWAFLWFTPVGAILSATLVWLIAGIITSLSTVSNLIVHRYTFTLTDPAHLR